MDGISTLDLGLFIAGAFVSALVTGIAGFAFAIVAAGVWLHVLTPVQSTSLIVAFGLLVQGVSVWKLRHALSAKRLLPFVVGGAIGVPAGVELLRWITAAELRRGVGVVLILFALWSLVRPRLVLVTGDTPARDTVMGILNGILGGAAGLAGIVVVMWASVRGWTSDEQRAVFQPTGVAVFVMTALWLGGSGRIGGDVIRLFLLGAPAVLVGTLLGLKLYGHLDQARFRQIVLVLLVVSGAALLL